ncbi:hypothetical protein CEXT_28681 [Caerostris extrusa]|uniref:Uncharacterized protein n=1 Tax=Caerostris extrusa TaxID=172846 RepID=A0AAV4M962_CAEEX|nr:hypothetical protein CEXT_28681 [Caerostris extrusa]
MLIPFPGQRLGCRADSVRTRRKRKAKTFARPSHIQWRAVTVKRPITIPGKGHSALEKAFSLHTFIAGEQTEILGGILVWDWGKLLKGVSSGWVFLAGFGGSFWCKGRVRIEQNVHGSTD